MRADGTGGRQLAAEEGGGFEKDHAWSPDGTQIAFNRWQRDDSGDWLVRAIGIATLDGTVRSIGVAPASEGALIEWSPDGKTIVSLPGTLVEAFTWSPTSSGSVARPALIDLAAGAPGNMGWGV